MGDLNYTPLIKDMTWSYSRLTSFEDCPYRWFLKYIKGIPEEDKFYSTYGSFIHKLIEGFYRGKIKRGDLETAFITGYRDEVKGERPPEAIVTRYLQKGCEYFRTFKPFSYEPLAVEKRISFKVKDIPFVGIIDFIGKDKEGNLVIIDNKSRDLKPRSNRSPPTKKDEELTRMLRQLYLYSTAVRQEYGVFPKSLCFNCFKEGVFIEEPFVPETYNAVIDWAADKVHEIERAGGSDEEFYPRVDYFACRWICGVSHECMFNEVINGGGHAGI